jgi:hypothetical protein
MPATHVQFVPRPYDLPAPERRGRTAVVDVAFAKPPEHERQTLPLIERLGADLVAWIDHHDHPAWERFAGDPRFVLVKRRDARACPQLVTPGLARALGDLDLIMAHHDVDGLFTAVKLLRGGEPPYPDADEDARAIDSPGHGFSLSGRGRRLALALDRTETLGQGRPELLAGLLEALVSGVEAVTLTSRIDSLAAAQENHERELRKLLRRVERPHAAIATLRARGGLTSADKKVLLRELCGMAPVGVLHHDAWSFVASFDDERYDLAGLSGLGGTPGYVFGKAPLATYWQQLLAIVERANP